MARPAHLEQRAAVHSVQQRENDVALVQSFQVCRRNLFGRTRSNVMNRRKHLHAQLQKTAPRLINEPALTQVEEGAGQVNQSNTRLRLRQFCQRIGLRYGKRHMFDIFSYGARRQEGALISRPLQDAPIGGEDGGKHIA